MMTLKTPNGAVALAVATPLITLSLLTNLLPIASLQAEPLPVSADLPPPPINNRLKLLIESLGSEDFATREAATRQLQEIGPRARDAVQQATHHANPEIRCRACRLLSQLGEQAFEQRMRDFVQPRFDSAQVSLPGWREFSELAGNGLPARRVYARMFRAERTLLERAFQQPTAEETVEPVTSGEIELRLTAVQRLTSHRQPQSCSQSQALASQHTIVFIATVKPNLLTDRSSQLTTQIARNGLAPYASVKATDDNDSNETPFDVLEIEIRRRAIAAWVLACPSSDLYVLTQNLQLTDRLELREAVPVAIAIATGKRELRPQHDQFRANALLTVGRLGTPADAARLAPLLEDTTVCVSQRHNRQNSKTPLLNVELRDVALAVMAHLSGDDPSELGLDQLATHPERLFVLRSIAFQSKAQRETALRTWQQRAKLELASRPLRNATPTTLR